MLKKFFLLFLTFIAYESFANSDQTMVNNDISLDSRETIFRCTMTKNDGRHILSKPKTFNRSNNLTRKSKDVFFSKGESIIMEGYVLDENCIPITNASLQLWQSNSYGFNQEELNAKKLSKSLEKLQFYDPQFASNGSTSSDNTGFYRFILIRPCQDCAKRIDMSAKHKRFQEIEKIVWIDTPSHMALMKDDREKSKATAKLGNSLEYELIDIYGCEEKPQKYLAKTNGQTIKTGGSFAKYIGKHDDRDVYRFDIILSGREEYRKY